MAESSYDINTRKAEQALDRIIAKLRTSAKELDLNADEVKELDREFDKMGKNVPKQVNTTNQSFDKMGGAIEKAGQALIAYFAFDKLKQIVLGAINIRAEFQKMEAVLTTALGSKSEAAIGMAMIQDFASKTPFAIKELTDSYVQLVNQGFKPTRAEMTSLGDLAASTGKTFDQLAQAVIDAQVGEFERLKEFGIRSKAQGDQVIFTFKGVETQVAKTDEAIRDYILSLGMADGVSGSMAAISETLGGKISNLGDNIDQLANKFGRFLENEAGGFLDFINKVLGQWTEVFTTDLDVHIERVAQRFETLTANLDQLSQVDINELFTTTAKQVEELSNKSRALTFETNLLRKAYEEGISPIEKMTLSQSTINKIYEDGELNLGSLVKLYEQKRDSLATLNVNVEAYKLLMEELNKRTNEAIDGEAKQIGIIQQLQDKIKEITAAREAANDTASIQKYNLQLALTREELERILNLGLQRPDAIEKILAIDPNATDAELEGLVNIYEKFFGKIEELGENYQGDLHKRIDAEIKARAEALEKQRELEEEQAQWLKSLKEETYYAAIDFTNALFNRESELIQRKIEKVQEQKNAELQAVGENAEGKAIIEQKYAAKEEELRRQATQNERRQAIVNKGIALAEIAYNTGVAVTKATAASPLTFGLPWSGYAIGLGLLQAGTVLAKPLPAYKDGVYDLDGPGTERSDSIHARLSKGESVVPAKASKQFGRYLKPMIEDKTFSHDKLQKLIMQDVEAKYNGTLFGPQSNKEELKELKAMNRALRKEKSYTTYLDGSVISRNMNSRNAIKSKIERRNRF